MYCYLYSNESPELKNIDNLFAGYVNVECLDDVLDASGHGHEVCASTLPQLTVILQRREVDRAAVVDCKNTQHTD